MNGNLAGEARLKTTCWAAERATLAVLADVADALDDMAALGTHWARATRAQAHAKWHQAAMLL